MAADQLLSLARDTSAESRQTLFEQVRDLLLEESQSVNARERALMGEILRRLVGDVEMSLRRRLAEQLARRSDAPHALIVELANDQIEVALPILVKSEVLKDPDLLDVIQHRQTEHQLAISLRKSVSEQVSGALVGTGSKDVIVSLLNNHGAKISREVYGYLAEESERVDEYQEPLVRRADLPVPLAERMYEWVSGALRQHIKTHFDVDGEALDAALAAATDASIEAHERESAAPTPSEDLVDRLCELGELDGAFLVKALRSGEVALFEKGLGKLSGLRSNVLRRIIFEPGGEALALVCKSAELADEAFHEIVRLLRRHVENDDTLEPDPKLFELYRQTAKADAERVVQRWRRSSQYLNAMERVSDRH